MKRKIMKSICATLAMVAVLGNVAAVEAKSQSDSRQVSSAILTGVSTIEKTSGRAYTTLSKRGSATVRSEYKYHSRNGSIKTVNQDTTTGGGATGGAWNFSLGEGCKSESISSKHTGGYNGTSKSFNTNIAW